MRNRKRFDDLAINQKSHSERPSVVLNVYPPLLPGCQMVGYQDQNARESTVRVAAATPPSVTFDRFYRCGSLVSLTWLSGGAAASVHGKPTIHQSNRARYWRWAQRGLPGLTLHQSRRSTRQ
ncbi:hypothetical protein PoB_000168800 [Plakobranchus ocellatus]|uniref:Uncharacterized protein n=1 Tax=Plakobranchus ocellatus TaxID=259542 RepID=A0AAV3XXU5_9GAST|nr:hypothetical protein PoB_000168800 [Plakobranchus ocellatus]